MQSLFDGWAVWYTAAMARWQPNAIQRLQQAATELILERGYEGTTVADIADRAGLTERTFFRYFADKREVLFAGAGVFEKFVIEAVRGSTRTDPLESVVAAFEAAAPIYFDARSDLVRLRRTIIMANNELHERELKKGGRIAAQVTAILTERGLERATAALVAELGLIVFRNAFDRWCDANEGSLGDYIRTTLEELRSVTHP
jgi:AcrR family transcriptional regulator